MKKAGRIWNPFKIGSRFYLKPPEFPEPGEGRIVIDLLPGRAFGSGEHETTRACLEIMETITFAPFHKVLDYGSGTGILSIAAVKLGAGSVTMLDIDADAIAACRNNAAANGVSDKATAICGDLLDISPGERFHIILANIFADVILERASNLAALLADDGILLLSGISREYLFEVKFFFERMDLRRMEQRMGEDYCTILFRR